MFKNIGKKGAGPLVLMAATAVILLVGIAGTLYLTGNLSITKKGGVKTGTGNGELARPGDYGDCNPQATNAPDIRFAITNNLNTSATDYVTGNVKLYEGDYSFDSLPESSSFVSDLTEVNTGYASAKDDANIQCGKTYTIAVLAGEGGRTSALKTVKMDEQQKTVTLNSPEQEDQVRFKAYDESNKGYVYADAETSANTWVGSGSTFYSNTGNSTGDSDGLGIAQGEDFEYNVNFGVNTTEATDKKANDYKYFVAVDRQSLADWQELELSIEDGTVVKADENDYDQKISNDGYDDIYEIKGVDITDSSHTLNVYGYPKSGVDPDDNIKLGFVTSGLYKHTTDTGLGLSTNKDDSSSTYVVSVDYVTLTFA